MSVVPVVLITLRNGLRILGTAFIAGGAVFLSYEHGIWGPGERNENHAKLLYKKAEENVFPRIPVHKLPTSEEMKMSWNNGMHAIFTTLDETPDHVKRLSDEAKKYFTAPKE